MNLTLLKTQTGFIPADTPTEEKCQKIKLGKIIHGDFKQMRNPGFHRKYFVLLNFAFDYWEPGELSSKYGTPEKNFDRYRKDVIILAGFYHMVVRLNGEVVPEADSISFANMDQETFEKLYNNSLTVLMNKINTLKEMGEDEINRVVDRLLQFA